MSSTAWKKQNDNFHFVANLPGVVDLSVVADATVVVGPVTMRVETTVKSNQLSLNDRQKKKVCKDQIAICSRTSNITNRFCH